MDEKTKLKQCINKVLAGELLRTIKSKVIESDCFDASPPKKHAQETQCQTAMSITLVTDMICDNNLAQ